MNKLLFRMKESIIQFSWHIYFPYPSSQRWCSQQEELKRTAGTDVLLLGWETLIRSLLFCVGYIESTHIER
jgi:hypothetical protein